MKPAAPGCGKRDGPGDVKPLRHRGRRAIVTGLAERQRESGSIEQIGDKALKYAQRREAEQRALLEAGQRKSRDAALALKRMGLTGWWRRDSGNLVGSEHFDPARRIVKG